MNERLRSLCVLAGLSLLFAALTILAAKPLPHLSMALPLVPVSGNVPYFLILRILQKMFGTGSDVLLMVNGVLTLLIGWAVFRAGWGLSDARHRLLGASTAMLLFVVSPLALILPVTLGFLGGYLLVALVLMIFLGAMHTVEHWSAFMRAITLALTWSLLLWVHVPTAVVVLLAMIPWILYSRRPGAAVGIFATVGLLGTALFAALWAAGCALADQWAIARMPLDSLSQLGVQIRESAASFSPGLLMDRLMYVAAWLSPFFLLHGLWMTWTVLSHMFRERRAGTAELAALIALAALSGVLVAPGKETLPGAWSMLLVSVLWFPLMARDLAVKENFFSRGFRLTFSTGFLSCLAVLLAIHRGILSGFWVPQQVRLIPLTLGVLGLGALSYLVLRKHPLTRENRVGALLTGATLAYYLVMDFSLLR